MTIREKNAFVTYYRIKQPTILEKDGYFKITFVFDLIHEFLKINCESYKFH